jgi:hypothetical protein
MALDESEDPEDKRKIKVVMKRLCAAFEDARLVLEKHGLMEKFKEAKL